MPTLEVRHDGTDITNYILDYRRELDICTGIGTVSIVVAKSYTSAIQVWDNIDVYEDGTKRGEFNVSKVQKDSESHSLKVFCQDNSKKLADYFIAEAYYINYYSTSRYWIEKFMTDAGVNYTFTTTSQGTPVSKDTTLGIEAAYEIIVRMLQQSGWYMYFNDQGNAVIGRFSLDYANYKKQFVDADILSITKVKDDKMLRNRAVVWGNANIETGEWVFADLKRTTTWNYSNNDFRTVLFSNHDILNSTIATDLASQILDEFCRITETKVVKLHGFHNVHIGDIVLIKSKYHNGIGIITSLEVTANDSGYITTLTLDERCPRLFSYYAFDQGKVYCGTNGDGVWQKDISGSTWTNFSTGIIDLQIKDLSVANGAFACVTASGQAYTRDVADTIWSLLTYGDFLDETDGTVTPAGSVKAIACDINRVTSETYILFYGGLKAWVGLVVNQVLVGTKQVYLNINGTKYTNLFVFDVGTDDSKVFVTVGSGALTRPIFYNFPFPVVEAFTHNNQEEVEGFGLVDYSTFLGSASNCVFDYGSVHWAQLNINKTTHVDIGNEIKIYSHQFNEPTIINTVSPWLTVSGYYFGVPKLHKASGSNSIYIMHQSNTNIFVHEIGSSSLEFHGSVSYTPAGGYDDFYNGVLYKTYIEDSGGIRTYKFAWYDIVTGTYDTIDFAAHETHDNIWDGDIDDTVGTWQNFGMIGALRWYVGKNNNNANDNSTVGCCSYDPEYFAYAYVVGIIFDTVSKQVFKSFTKLVHPDQTIDASDEYCTSHCNLSLEAHRRVAARWVYLDYNEGIPYIWVQFNMLDDGPWTGVVPPYTKLGYRENFYASPAEYPRVFLYNPIDDEHEVQLDTGYDQNYHSASLLEILKRITLTSSETYFTTQFTSSIPLAGVGWRNKEHAMPTNLNMRTWNLNDHNDESQEKMDYFYNQYPMVQRYKATSSKYYYNFRAYDFNAISGYAKDVYLTQMPFDDDEGSGGFTGQYEQKASQNVFAIKMGYVYWRDRFNPNTYDTSYGWQFYRFGTWTDFLIKFYATTVNVTSGFQIVDMTQLPQYLEIGSSGPIVTFAKAISGYVGAGALPSGVLRIGTTISGMYLPSGYTLGGTFPSGFIPNYSFITPPGNYTVISDARPFRVNPTTQLPLASGYMITSGITVVGLAMGDSVVVRPITDLTSESGWQVVVAYPNEIVTNLETTHFFNPQYMFIAVASGYSTSGFVVTFSGLSRFYQRNPGNIAWYQYSPTVSSYITCIRVDNRV